MLRLKDCGNFIVSLVNEIKKELFNIDEVIKMAVITIFSNPDGRYSHFLLEGPPGLGKTVLCKCISSWCNLKFNRIQLTPDMQPGEIVMTHELVMKDKSVYTKMVFGPIFTNILLADEINRTPPRTQASILQPMAELETTYGGRTYNLGYDMTELSEYKGDSYNNKLKELYDENSGKWIESPEIPLFYVFATQNPIENEGTYRLPEAQLDRFLFKIDLDYPSEETLQTILKRKSVIGQFCTTYFKQNKNSDNLMQSIIKEKKINSITLNNYITQYSNLVIPLIEKLYPFNSKNDDNMKILHDEIEKMIYLFAPQFKKSENKATANPAKVIQIRNTINLFTGISDPIYYNYITYILRQIIRSNDFDMKVSPRVCDTILSVAKAHCIYRVFNEKNEIGDDDFDPDILYITKEDINSCAKHMLPHRVSLSFEAQSKGLNTRQLIETILNKAYNETKFRGIE